MTRQLWMSAGAVAILVSVGGALTQRMMGGSHPTVVARAFAGSSGFPEELRVLKPYLSECKTTYRLMTWSPKSKPIYIAEHELSLDGVDQYDAIDKLRAKLTPAKGWAYDGSCGMITLLYRRFTSASPPEGIYSINSCRVASNSKVGESTRVGVSERLTSYQVAMVRLQHLGKDPFERS